MFDLVPNALLELYLEAISEADNSDADVRIYEETYMRKYMVSFLPIIVNG